MMALEQRISAAVTRWNLVLGPALQGGSWSHVFLCTDAGGTSFVLKLPPSVEEAVLEVAALRAWGAKRAVRLLDHAPDFGALLLERVVPGTPLPPGDELRNGKIAASVLAALHAVPPPGSLPNLAGTLHRRVEETLAEAEPGAAGCALLEQAGVLGRYLCASTRHCVLLHGDFIDKNLLLGRHGYVAIDPIPCVGDPCCDIGLYASYHPPARHIAARAQLLAQFLGHDPLRAQRWAAVWSVCQGCETWRSDSEELQAWVRSAELRDLLSP